MGHDVPRSACASVQSDQGLHCPLTESMATRECKNGDKCTDDTNLLNLRMFESNFLLDRAHIECL